MRVGVIGTGNIARQVHLPVLTSMPGVRVVWVADVDAASAASVARAFKLRSIPLPLTADPSSDCDVALVASPVATRRPHLEHLAGRGIAAFVEKPFARTVAEHLELASLFPPSRVGCGFMRRTYDSTTIVRRILTGGWLGPLTRIVVREGGRFTRSGTDRSYVDDDAGGGGILIELGCHALDLAFHLTGATRHTVVRQRMLFDGGADRVAEGEVQLQATGAEPIPLEFRFSWLDDVDSAIELHFPSSRLIVGSRPATPVRLAGAGSDPGVALSAAAGATTTNQAFYLEWREFLDGLREERPSAFAAATTLPVTALIEDIYARGRGR
jgi:predicted dehydrogenase